MALHELLSQRRPLLTPAQTRTAEYIMTHHEQTVFLTASALARKAGVSEATVVRLAQSLGFDGYPDMQRFFTGIDPGQVYDGSTAGTIRGTRGIERKSSAKGHRAGHPEFAENPGNRLPGSLSSGGP